MKKLLFIVLCMAVFASLAMAQTYTKGVGLTGIDKLGAHQNGGRGCTGCHAPHSGSAGGGGNAGNGNVQDLHDGYDALWGQDMGPLYGVTLGFGAVRKSRLLEGTYLLDKRPAELTLDLR